MERTASDATQELLDVSRRLLRSIDTHDWKTYTELCDPGLTAFEPEGRGHLVEGLPFHGYYLEEPAGSLKRLSSISSPRVRMLGDGAAVVTYVRLVQRTDEVGNTTTAASEETRVWEKQQGRWRHVHFHRSPCP